MIYESGKFIHKQTILYIISHNIVYHLSDNCENNKTSHTRL